MGNQKSEINIEKFRREDWEAVEKLPDMQVWQNRRDPSCRIEQYELYTQNQAELRHEQKMFELRRRSPLLVSAYYLETHPNQEFCSSITKHFLYLERVPIRLADIEHVPYPDYLHLFDACLKGFGQLARCAGYFIVDEAMIGINEQGMAKAWLHEDFSKGYPFGGQTTQQNMVRSLIETIERNIDSELLPFNVPSVRNFLYKNADALTFDTAIWQLGQFVKIFNQGKMPSKLDCIDRAGGIYTIANREQLNENLQRSDGYQMLQNGTGFSEVNGYRNPDTDQRLSRQLSNPELRLQRSQEPFERKEVKIAHQPPPQYIPIASGELILGASGNNQPRPLMATFGRREQAIQGTLGSPRQSAPVAQSNIIHNRPTISFVTQTQANSIMSPRRSQQIVFQPPTQLRRTEIRENHVQGQPIPYSSRSPPHSLPIPINFQRNATQGPPLLLNSPSHMPRQVSPRVIQSQVFPHPTLPQHFTQQVVHSPVIVAPPAPAQTVALGSQVSKAPRFTVQVIPGKVIPQKSSTIFKQSTILKAAHPESETTSLLDQHKPKIISSEKTVTEEGSNNPQPLRQNQEEKPKQVEIVHEVKAQHSIINEVAQTYAQQQQIQQQRHQFAIEQKTIHNHETEVFDQRQIAEVKEKPFLTNIQTNFDALQKKLLVSASYEGEEMPTQSAQPSEQLPVIEEKHLLDVNHSQGLRQDRMSLWTAGSQEKQIDYEELEKKLAISFNPDYQENPHTDEQVQSAANQHYYEPPKESQNHFQDYQGQNNGDYAYQQTNYEIKLNNEGQAGLNFITQTGQFGYSSSPNELVDPEGNANEDIRQTATFKAYSPEYLAEKQQYDNYSYDPNSYAGYSNYGNYGNFNTYNAFESKSYDYQNPFAIEKPASANLKSIEESDGKSSPDFLRRLNEMTALEPETLTQEPYQATQNSRYSQYLKNLTKDNKYSSYSNELNYEHYANPHDYEDSNEFEHSGDSFKGYSYKIDIDHV